jgi:hypothetical protein
VRFEPSRRQIADGVGIRPRRTSRRVIGSLPIELLIYSSPSFGESVYLPSDIVVTDESLQQNHEGSKDSQVFRTVRRLALL